MQDPVRADIEIDETAVPILTGDRIYLRPVQEADATDTYVKWLNDPETTRYLESGRMQETVDSIKAYIRRYHARENALFLAIILKEGALHIGNIKLEPINWVHKEALLGIMIGDPRARGKGIGMETIRLVLNYAFDVLELHRVGLGVTSDNLQAISCYENLGFQREGIIREAISRKNGFVDRIWMGLLRKEYRNLSNQTEEKQ